MIDKECYDILNSTKNAINDIEPKDEKDTD